MNTETRLPNRSISAQTPIRVAALAVLCSLVAAAALPDQAAGHEHEVTVAIQVSAQGLDLSQPAGGKKLYWHLSKCCVGGLHVW